MRRAVREAADDAIAVVHLVAERKHPARHAGRAPEQEPAVDGQQLPGDQRRIGGKPHDRLRDVFGRAGLLQRGRVGPAVAHALVGLVAEPILEPARLDQARQHAIHADLGREIAREREGQRVQRGLRRHIGIGAAVAVQAADRRHVHDRAGAAGAQMRRRRARHLVRADHVDGVDLLEVLGVLSVEIAQAARTGSCPRCSPGYRRGRSAPPPPRRPRGRRRRPQRRPARRSHPRPRPCRPQRSHPLRFCCGCRRSRRDSRAAPVPARSRRRRRSRRR